MTIPFIDEATIDGVLDFPGLVDALDIGHRHSDIAVDRKLMEMPNETGSTDAFLIWPAWKKDEVMGIKLVTSFPGNPARHLELPTIQAVYVLFDATNGSPLALIDGTALTHWKTAADSALGSRYLSRADAETLLMVGAGALAPSLIAAHRAIRPSIARILLWNRTRARSETLARAVGGNVVDDLEAAVREADIVSCATRAREPLVLGDWLRPGVHLDLVGGFTPEMREADDEAVRRARVYVDSRAFTVEDAGDIRQAIANGIIGPDDIVGDLFDLSNGRASGRQADEEITLFKNAGGAHLDLITARYVYDRVSPAR